MLYFSSNQLMILEQHFPVCWSRNFFVASNYNDCGQKGLLFRFVERNINLRCSTKLECDRLAYMCTSIAHRLSERAANRGKPSIGSSDTHGNINLRKAECNLGDRYNDAVQSKGVQDARNARESVAQNQKDNRGHWQSLLSGFRNGVRADTRSWESGKYASDDKMNIKRTDRPRQGKTNAPQILKGTKSWIQFLGLLDPSPENLVVLLLAVLLLVTNGQTLFEVFVVLASIVVTALQYAAIAVMLLGILLALL